MTLIQYITIPFPVLTFLYESFIYKVLTLFTFRCALYLIYSLRNTYVEEVES